MVLSTDSLLRIIVMTAFLGGFILGLTPLNVNSFEPAYAAESKKAPKKAKRKASPAASAVVRYVKAVSKGDRLAVGHLDFSCQYRMVSASAKGVQSFPKKSDALYDRCWEPIAQANAEPVQTKHQAMNVLWPGTGKLIFFGEPLDRYPYAASAFVSELLGKSPSESGFRTKVLSVKRLPPASFRIRPEGDVVAAPATMVHLRVNYTDPLTSPVTYAPGTVQWANPIQRPREALKAVTLKWVVLSRLKKLGFPGDLAVVNLPVVPAQGHRPATPLLAQNSGYLKDSADWWSPSDHPDHLVIAVGLATQLEKLDNRVAMLNRVLMIDPNQIDALTALTRDLYEAILENGAAALPVKVTGKSLANRLTEFYWDTYAEHERLDISLGMEMGGYAKPTTADYLFRMIPAMEKLAELQPQDMENRFRLGVAYRWNLDQLTAIDAHQALVKALPPDRASLRARALTELAWSKITMVAFNRSLDDPAIQEAYKEAEEAFNLSDRPMDKFVAAYTMAYSLVYWPNRDNQAMLSHLTDAKRWFMQVDGATEEAWRMLLRNETLKRVIDADPAFQHLVAAGDRG